MNPEEFKRFDTVCDIFIDYRLATEVEFALIQTIVKKF